MIEAGTKFIELHILNDCATLSIDPQFPRVGSQLSCRWKGSGEAAGTTDLADIKAVCTFQRHLHHPKKVPKAKTSEMTAAWSSPRGATDRQLLSKDIPHIYKISSSSPKDKAF